MAQVHLQLVARKRWFFWPAALVLVLLWKMGAVGEAEARAWLAKNGVAISVEPR